MSSGPSWERGYDERDNDRTWSKSYERSPLFGSSYTQKDVYPDHGENYTEYEYRNGSTYREYDDGTVEKTK